METGEPIRVAGQLEVQVKYGSQAQKLPLLVAGKGPTLLGHDWLQQIRLDWKSIGLTFLDAGRDRVQILLERYPKVFDTKPGTMRHFQATLRLRKDAKPVFCKARSVPFALKKTVGEDLDRLEKEGILVKVNSSEWATPIVPVPKGDGRIRPCGDYKVTVSSSLKVDQYPLPKPDELFASLAGGKRFTKLDLTQAYQQMPLQLESQKLVVVNTHQGLYRYTQLPFGIAPAPAISFRGRWTPYCRAYLRCCVALMTS